MEDGRWKMEDGKVKNWTMEDGRWKIEVGRCWKLEVGSSKVEQKGVVGTDATHEIGVIQSNIDIVISIGIALGTQVHEGIHEDIHEGILGGTP